MGPTTVAWLTSSIGPKAACSAAATSPDWPVVGRAMPAEAGDAEGEGAADGEADGEAPGEAEAPAEALGPADGAADGDGAASMRPMGGMRISTYSPLGPLVMATCDSTMPASLRVWRTAAGSGVPWAKWTSQIVPPV